MSVFVFRSNFRISHDGNIYVFDSKEWRFTSGPGFKFYDIRAEFNEN